MKDEEIVMERTGKQAHMPAKERIKGAVQLWKNSKLFKFIDAKISAHYRRRLKNDHFTILTPNCLAGVIYHRLGKEFLTPIINMWLPQPDFAAFCLHLEYYLAQELCFIETDKGFPVAQLKGDGNSIPTITLNFNHDKIPETARENWERRKTRIVRENMYIILYKLDGITVEQLKSLEQLPCKGMAVLTATPLPEIPWSVYIKPVPSHRYPLNYLEKDVFGVRYFERKFDYISFLNDESKKFKQYI